MRKLVLVALIGFMMVSLLPGIQSESRISELNVDGISALECNFRLKLAGQENTLSGYGKMDTMKVVKGLLKGELNEILVGSTILVKGTEKGVISGVDGEYKIDITDDLTSKDSVILEFINIGYKSEERVINRESFNEKEVLLLNVVFDESLKLDGYRPSIFKRLVLTLKRIFT
ncbi:MAG: hypothetical protein AAGA77_09705 [Bacteroidota bacterium]